MLFLLKISITPLLVAAVTLAARRWGPSMGGMLVALPWFTGPVLYVLILDRGIAFGEAACVGIELGVVCVSAFMLAYALVAAVAGWPLSLAAGVAAFFASGALLSEPAVLALLPGAIPPLWTAAGLAAASLCIAFSLLPRPRGALPPQAPAWWDIPARMAATALLVTVVVTGAEALGPRLAGIASTYPIIVSVMGAFTHRIGGREAAWAILRGFAASLFGFVAFFLVVGLALPVMGAAGAYALAALASLSITAGLVATHRARQVRRVQSSDARRQLS
jgi:hypothetical protein